MVCVIPQTSDNVEHKGVQYIHALAQSYSQSLATNSSVSSQNKCQSPYKRMGTTSKDYYETFVVVPRGQRPQAPRNTRYFSRGTADKYSTAAC